MTKKKKRFFTKGKGATRKVIPISEPSGHSMKHSEYVHPSRDEAYGEHVQRETKNINNSNAKGKGEGETKMLEIGQEKTIYTEIIGSPVDLGAGQTRTTRQRVSIMRMRQTSPKMSEKYGPHPYATIYSIYDVVHDKWEGDTKSPANQKYGGFFKSYEEALKNVEGTQNDKR